LPAPLNSNASTCRQTHPFHFPHLSCPKETNTSMEHLIKNKKAFRNCSEKSAGLHLCNKLEMVFPGFLLFCTYFK
uniref:Uncharacterized protein n=1 Tax=Oryzias latipes TaxID=8090 RepID=A0A3P9JVL1_ORYLA